jgi:hypothetical protein
VSLLADLAVICIYGAFNLQKRMENSNRMVAMPKPDQVAFNSLNEEVQHY